LGSGVRVVATERVFVQGSLEQTGNALDLAIQGNGFFQIERADGTLAYTRDGTFQLDNQGNVVTPSGYLLADAINIPEDAQSITVGKDGTVSVLQAGDIQPIEVGQIQLASFINPGGLQAIGENLFVETASSGIATPN